MEEWFWGVYGTGMGDANIDGSIDLNANKLPWIKDADSAEEDINSGDTATIAIAKKYMTDWAAKLKVGRNSLVCVDMDPAVSWNSGNKIKFYGVITKLNPKHKEHLTIKADNQLAVFKRQVACTLFNAGSTKPSDGVTFTGLTDQALMGNIIRHGFNTALAPAGQRPANILGTVSGVSTGSTKTLKALYSENKSIADLLINYRDNISTYGNEFRFLPVFTSSAMNLIRLNAWIGEDSVAGAHLNESQTVTINIETPDQFNKMVEMSAVHNIDGVATRWIVQTKAGDESSDSGSDLFAKSNTGTDLPRLDAFFNPGVELTTEERDAQAQAHLDASATFAEVSFSVEEDFKTDWKSHLGKTISFVGSTGTEFAEFNMTVRCVSLSWSASNGSVNVGLTVKQPRYPLLPKDRQRGKTGSDYSSPIITPTNPNVPKVSGGGFPTFPVDDWDKGKQVGQDAPPPPIEINWKGIDSALWSANYYAKIWGDGHIYNMGEGHTVVADDANGRFISLNIAHLATMWGGKAQRGSLPDITIQKTKKFASKPTGTSVRDGDAALGLTGTGGTFYTLTWADISAQMLSGSVDAFNLQDEVFEFGLHIRGPVSKRTVTIFILQLQLLSDGSTSRIRSKNMAFELDVNSDYEPQTVMTYNTKTLFSGNAGYDDKLSFFAFGSQIGSETGKDISKTVVLTPRAYPKDVSVPNQSAASAYWASINMGQYSIMNLSLVKDWNSGNLLASSGPSTDGKDYDDVAFIVLPGIDQSVKVVNLYACDVIDDYVYASSMTSYGKKSYAYKDPSIYGSYSLGERLITRAQITSKPATGLSSWTKLTSGSMYGASSDLDHTNVMNFFTTTRRATGEIIFSLRMKTGDSWTETAVLAKNDATAIRSIKDTGINTSVLGKNTSHWQKFTYSGGNQTLNSFPDFYNISNVHTDYVSSYTYPWYAYGTDYARWVWGGTLSNYSQMKNQSTMPGKSLKRSDFTVTMLYGLNYFANYDNDNPLMSWRWE